MKKLINYLKTLWSWVADSQSTDVSLDCRRSDLRCSPSGLDAKWKQNPFMRFAVVLTLIFTIGSGNVWGANYNQMTSGTDALSNGDEVLIAIQDRKAGKFYFVQCGSTKHLEQTVTAGVVSNPAATTIWVATKSSDNWIFRKKDAASNGYLYNSGSNTTLATDNNTSATWYVSNASSGSPAYKYFKMQQGGSSGRYISWSGSTFAAYANSNWSSNGVQPANSNIVQYNGALQIFKKATATAHTVRFYTASGTYTDLPEASAGAGVTPPTMSTPCDGWAFQGWSKSQSTSSTSTTVLSTETLTDGKYYPNADITLYPVYTKEVEETTIISDVLTNSTTGISGTTYTAWSNKTSNSDAVYAGKSAGQYTSIQLNASSPNGFWTTSSGGIAKKVIVEWNSNTANARVLQIFGKSSKYASSDLYSSTPATKGTNIGTITNGTTTEVTLSADYAYIGLRSSSNALYLNKVTIQWETEVTTTYYYSYPTCCTQLGSINGSFFGTPLFEPLSLDYS